jgi:chromosome segregation ATPase
LTEKIKTLTHQLEKTQSDEKAAKDIANKVLSEQDKIRDQYEAQITDLQDKYTERDSLLSTTLEDLNEQTTRLNDIKEDIEQAEEAIRVYRDRIS